VMGRVMLHTPGGGKQTLPQFVLGFPFPFFKTTL